MWISGETDVQEETERRNSRLASTASKIHYRSNHDVPRLKMAPVSARGRRRPGTF